MTYPHSPGFKATDTSLSAAKSTESRALTLRRKCLVVLEVKGPMTADEIAAQVSESILAIRPRLSELRQMGRVVDTGDRRQNISGKMAIVWQASGTPVQTDFFNKTNT